MNIAILQFETERRVMAPGTAMIMREFLAHGHDVTMIQEFELQVRFGLKDRVFYQGKPMQKFDAIVARPGIRSDPSVHAVVLRQLELDGQYVINGYVGVHRAKNKIRTLQILDNYGIPIPKTTVIFSDSEIEVAMKDFTFPVIVKEVYGSGGRGVFIAESMRSLTPIIQYLTGDLMRNHPVKIQEYIRESRGMDLRVFVVGKKVVATMMRSAKRGDFRANFHQGGAIENGEPTEEEKKIAIDAARATGLEIAGVDLLRSKTGPVVIEVNSYVGLEGITAATGINIAGKIVKYVERRVAKKQGKEVGKKEKNGKEG